MKFPFKKPDISLRRLVLLWIRTARKFFATLFFISVGFAVYVWYADVYRGEWSDEEKRAYAESAFQETVFNESEFRKSVGTAEKRSMLHGEDVVVTRNFFVPIPGMENNR